MFHMNLVQAVHNRRKKIEKLVRAIQFDRTYLTQTETSQTFNRQLICLCPHNLITYHREKKENMKKRQIYTKKSEITINNSNKETKNYTLQLN